MTEREKILEQARSFSSTEQKFDVFVQRFDEAGLIAFYKAAQNEAYEKAAQVCDGTCNVNNCLNDEEAYYGREMAKAIRQLKEQS